MTTRDPGRYRPRLQRRLMFAFAGYTLLVGTLLGALSFMVVYAVEDEFFAAALRTEAERQQTHHARHGEWTEPAQDFVRLYPRGEGLPPDLAARRDARPPGREFEGDDGRYYHVQELAPDGTVLVAEVSAQLVVRPLRDTLLLWLLGAGGVATAASLLLAWWLAERTSAPLGRLAQRIADGSPGALPEDLARGLARDEVGELARHLDALHERTRAFIAREQALTADASHELRTPLAVLGVACERLRAGAPEDLQPLVQSMQVAVWQLQQTVELLLAAAREPPTDASPTPQPLLPLVERLILAHAPLLDRQRIAVEVDVAPNLTRPWPPALQAGYAVLALDARGHGDRKDPVKPLVARDLLTDLHVWGEREPYERLIVDTVRDYRVLLDWVVQQPQFDASRVRAAGYSMGAQMALLLAGTDSRVRSVAAIVPPHADAKVAAVSPYTVAPALAAVEVWLLTADDDEHASRSDNARLFTALRGGGNQHLSFPGGHVRPATYVEALRPWLLEVANP